MPAHSQKPPLVIDLVGAVLRKPSAAPMLTPSEVIAIALSGTPWVSRIVRPDDLPVEAILKCLDDAGWAIVPK